MRDDVDADEPLSDATLHTLPIQASETRLDEADEVVAVAGDHNDADPDPVPVTDAVNDVEPRASDDGDIVVSQCTSLDVGTIIRSFEGSPDRSEASLSRRRKKLDISRHYIPIAPTKIDRYFADGHADVD